MPNDAAVLLIASACPDERRWVEATTKKLGADRVPVTDAAEAIREIESRGGRAALIIDSGLLLAPHDPQWRTLRAQRPDLFAVVRCLRANGGRIECFGGAPGRTWTVEPDDGEALRSAVRSALRLPSDRM